MDRCNNQACIKVSARAIGDCLKARAYQIGGEIKTRCTPKNIIKSVATLLNQPLVVRCGIVCSINNSEYRLKFEKATLFWNDSENRVGTTKYNTLVATGNWTLEEIQIEELL